MIRFFEFIDEGVVPILDHVLVPVALEQFREKRPFLTVFDD